MAVPELAGELLASVGRFFVWLFMDFFLELIVKGTGHLIVRPFKPEVSPDGVLVLVVGVAFWLIVGGGAALAYQALTTTASG